MRKLINPWRERGDLDEWDEDEFYERIARQNFEATSAVRKESAKKRSENIVADDQT